MTELHEKAETLIRDVADVAPKDAIDLMCAYNPLVGISCAVGTTGVDKAAMLARADEAADKAIERLNHTITDIISIKKLVKSAGQVRCGGG